VTRFSPRLALSIAAAFFALAALAGPGCSSGDDSGGSGADDGASLEGKIWKATEIEGVTAVLTEEGTEVTAAFAAGELSGSGGVNRYTAAYETRSGGKIEISQPAATLMAAGFSSSPKPRRTTLAADEAMSAERRTALSRSSRSTRARVLCEVGSTDW